MEIVNDSSLAVAWVPGRVNFPEHSLTLVVKGRFKMVPGGAAVADEAEPPLPTGDEFHGGDPEQSLRYDSDFAFFKPRADLMLVGTCHPPGGKPHVQCRASFGVNSWVKSLMVVGDRYWVGTAAGRRASEPKPFTAMPLRYENAFGGSGYAANPLGKGMATIQDAQGQKIWPLPNIEYPNQAVQSTRDQPTPAGFGPVSRSRLQRMAGMGTYNGAWEAERWPWFPKDFDWTSLNAAPLDQQVQTYLRGDEQLYFENLHAEHAEYRCRLPDIRPRCLVVESEGETRKIREVPLKLDTLWVDMDNEALVLVWRGLTPIRGPEHEELSHVHLAAEALSESPKSPEARLQAVLNTRDAAAQFDPARTPSRVMARGRAPKAPKSTAKVDIEAEVAQALSKMRESFLKAGISPEKIDAIAGKTDPREIVRALLPEAGDPDQAVAKANAERREKISEMVGGSGFDPAILELLDDRNSTTGLLAAIDGLRKLFTAQGQDTSVLDQAESAAKAAAEEEVAEAAAREDTGHAVGLSGQNLSGRDFSGQDLSGETFAGSDLSDANFSSANLRGANFTDAILTGADLNGANLKAADLTRATLLGANLAGAVLRGAKLRNANASAAKAAEADLRGADLQGAVLAEATLTGADLREALASSVRLRQADLTGADLSQSDLTTADLSGSTIDNAKFDGARLAEATLEGASGAAVSMVKADLTGLRAGGGSAFSGGSFRQVRGEGSLWFEADLTGADFTFADLPRADFRAADLSGGKLAAVDLKEGNLTKTTLKGADARSANFFRARLREAKLDGADFSQSNCYEAEFQNAVIHKTRFEGANLKGTKLTAKRGAS